jgi:hypothetical protein
VVEAHHGWGWRGAGDGTGALVPCVGDCVRRAVGGAGAGNLGWRTRWEDDPVSGLGGVKRGGRGSAGRSHDGSRSGSKSGTRIITGDAQEGGV